MRILLGNHQLESRGGSELFTAELARAFQARGHEVAAFTFFKGALAADLERSGVPVFEPEDREAITAFAPQIVQTNHLPCAHFLRAAVPDAVRVHAMLGVVPPLESPPLEGAAYALGLVVSEEVRDHVGRTMFGRSAPVEILRNWFDDGAAVAPPVPNPRGQATRIAVVSNHIAPQLCAALQGLGAESPAEVDYFGAQGRSVAIDGPLLASYDCVVSIGRTAILAAACGVPCVMADVHGSDGLLTERNLDDVRQVNFSGRSTRAPITLEHLRGELSKAQALDRQALRTRMLAEYALSARAEQLLLRYQALLEEKPRLGSANGGAPPGSPPPGEGLVHAELAAEVRRLRRALGEAQAARAKPGRVGGMARRLERRLASAFRAIAALTR